MFNSRRTKWQDDCLDARRAQNQDKLLDRTQGKGLFCTLHWMRRHKSAGPYLVAQSLHKLLAFACIACKDIESKVETTLKFRKGFMTGTAKLFDHESQMGKGV